MRGSAPSSPSSSTSSSSSSSDRQKGRDGDALDEVSHVALRGLYVTWAAAQRNDLAAFLREEARSLNHEEARSLNHEEARRSLNRDDEEAEEEDDGKGAALAAWYGREEEKLKKQKKKVVVVSKQSPAKKKKEPPALDASLAALEKCKEDRVKVKESRRQLIRSVEELRQSTSLAEKNDLAELEALERSGETALNLVRRERARFEAKQNSAADDEQNDGALDLELEAMLATVAQLRVAGESRRKRRAAADGKAREAASELSRRVAELQEAVTTAETEIIGKKKRKLPSNVKVYRATPKKAIVTKEAPVVHAVVKEAPAAVVKEAAVVRHTKDEPVEVRYKNGTRKTTEADGRTVVRFANGDVKRVDAAGRVVYYYADAQTTHSTDPQTSIEIFEFPNGQLERHSKDGSKEIFFPDGTRKLVDAAGRSRTVFADGAVVEEDELVTEQSLVN